MGGVGAWGIGNRIVNDGWRWPWQSRDVHGQGTDPVNWPHVHELQGPRWPGYYVTGVIRGVEPWGLVEWTS